MTHERRLADTGGAGDNGQWNSRILIGHGGTAHDCPRSTSGFRHVHPFAPGFLLALEPMRRSRGIAQTRALWTACPRHRRAEVRRWRDEVGESAIASPVVGTRARYAFGARG